MPFDSHQPTPESQVYYHPTRRGVAIIASLATAQVAAGLAMFAERPGLSSILLVGGGFTGVWGLACNAALESDTKTADQAQTIEAPVREVKPSRYLRLVKNDDLEQAS